MPAKRTPRNPYCMLMGWVATGWTPEQNRVGGREGVHRSRRTARSEDLAGGDLLTYKAYMLGGEAHHRAAGSRETYRRPRHSLR